MIELLMIIAVFIVIIAFWIFFEAIDSDIAYCKQCKRIHDIYEFCDEEPNKLLKKRDQK